MTGIGKRDLGVAMIGLITFLYEGICTLSHLRRKEAPGSETELSPGFKEMNGLRNKEKGVVTFRQDHTRSNFLPVKRN